MTVKLKRNHIKLILVISLGIIGITWIIKILFSDFLIGKLNLKTGNYATAIEKLEKVIKKNPENLLAHFYLGLAYIKNGNHQRAINEFNFIKERKPNLLVSAELHNEIGMFYYLKEKYSEAVEEFKKVVLLKPTAESYFNLGIAYSALGDIQNAISAYSSALKINPRHTFAHWNLAINLEKIGDFEQAIFHWKKYIEFTPGVFRHPEVEEHILELEKQIKIGGKK